MTQTSHDEEADLHNGREGREDAKDRLARRPVRFQLDDLRKRLQGESEWKEKGRDQFALFHAGALRTGYFAFQAGTGLKDHKVNGHVNILVLQGSLEVSGEGRETTTIGTSGFLGLDGMKTFTVMAKEETYAVMVFCQDEGVAEPARGNDPGTQVTK